MITFCAVMQSDDSRPVRPLQLFGHFFVGVIGELFDTQTQVARVRRSVVDQTGMVKIAVILLESLHQPKSRKYLLHSPGQGINETLEIVAGLLAFALAGKKSQWLSRVGPHLGDPDRQIGRESIGAKPVTYMIQNIFAADGIKKALVSIGHAVPVKVEHVNVVTTQICQNRRISNIKISRVVFRAACYACDQHRTVGKDLLDGLIGDAL